MRGLEGWGNIAQRVMIKLCHRLALRIFLNPRIILILRMMICFEVLRSSRIRILWIKRKSKLLKSHTFNKIRILSVE